MLVQFQFRTDTLAAWLAANPVLEEGEPAYERDTHMFRIGDGTTPYASLPVQSADPVLLQTIANQATTAAATATAAAAAATAASGGLVPATDTAAGIVELATTTETTTGTDATRAVTPAGLAARIAALPQTASPDATTVVKGLIEIATTAEATAGTDTVRAVTPAGLAAAISASGVATPDATETVKGKVELATAAETTTGTDLVRATHPAGVAAAISAAIAAFPAATATVQGKVELATTAEATAGTDTVRAVTPAGLAAALAGATGTTVTWSTLSGKPVVIAAGADAATARGVIAAADDAVVVKLATAQTISGAKTFTGAAVFTGTVSVPDGALTVSDIANFSDGVTNAANDNSIPRIITYTGATLPADPGNGYYLAVKTDTATPLAIAVNTLASYTSSTDAASYTATISRAVGSATEALVFVGSGVSGAAAAQATSLAGIYPTWTKVQGNSTANTNLAGTLWRGTGTPDTSTSLTISFGGATQGGVLAKFLEIVNGTYKSSTTMDQTASATPAVSLTGVSTANTVLGFVLQQTSTDLTVGTGFTEVDTLLNPGGAPPSLSLKTEMLATGQNSVGFSGATAAQKLIVAAEIMSR